MVALGRPKVCMYIYIYIKPIWCIMFDLLPWRKIMPFTFYYCYYEIPYRKSLSVSVCPGVMLMIRCPKWPGLTAPTSSSPVRTSGPWTPVWTWWQRASLSTVCAFRRWTYTTKGPTPARSRPSSSPRPPRCTLLYKVSLDHGLGMWVSENLSVSWQLRVTWHCTAVVVTPQHRPQARTCLSVIKDSCLPACQTDRDLNVDTRRLSGKVYELCHGWLSLLSNDGVVAFYDTTALWPHIKEVS